mgnify:CR=1 FL=1
MNDVACDIIVLASGPDSETEATGPGVVLEESFFQALRPCLNGDGPCDVLFRKARSEGLK